MISLHMIKDCDIPVSWEVVVNGEVSTPIGVLNLYSRDNIVFIPANTNGIDIKDLIEITKIFRIWQ